MRQRILLVDDNDAVTSMLKWPLQDAGYEVVVRRNGFQALRTIGNELYDLLVTDLDLSSSIDGLELIRQSRQEHPNTPVIGMSGSRYKFKPHGTDAYFEKPFDCMKLLRTVGYLLSPGRPALEVVT